MPTQDEVQNNIYGGNNQVAGRVDNQNQFFLGEEFARKILRRKEHPITVVVTGPGVDTAMGIPAPEDLLPRIAGYLATDGGKAVDTALRKAIGRVRFHFDTFIDKAIDNLARNLDSEMQGICSNVQAEISQNASLTDEHRKLGRLVALLFHKIIDVKRNAVIDDETEQLIGDVLGAAVKDDTIIDFSRLNYTGTFKAVVVEILQRSVRDHGNPILRHVYRNILDVGQLLAQHFYSFYQGKGGGIRDYMYISWMLWAYLVSEERRIAAVAGDAAVLPGVYDRLRGMENTQLVTLNHTTFAQRCAADALYFRGSPMEYVDVENKNDFRHGDLGGIDLVDFFGNQLAGMISFDADCKSLPIPSFLPPLKLMPVISQRYIDVWYRTGEMLRHAERVAILGCSLASADNYFCDMLRQSGAKEIIVTAADMEETSRHLCGIFQLASNAYSPCLHSGHKARKYGNRITVVEAEPSDVDLISQL